MPCLISPDELWFPDVESADEEGLLAIGGDLSTERLILAYRSGIFPWFSERGLPFWFSPDPRFVLYPDALKVSKSMQQLFKKEAFKVTINKDFEGVIRACATVQRGGQHQSWITEDFIEAYTSLNRKKLAVSVEVWKEEQLVGGLYGLKMGRLFFGESMFSRLPNASKYGFISYVRQLREEGVVLIDCQTYTEHLESLGASAMPRSEFIALLREQLPLSD